MSLPMLMRMSPRQQHKQPSKSFPMMMRMNRRQQHKRPIKYQPQNREYWQQHPRQHQRQCQVPIIMSL